ncbi:MAG: penicillin acylase family protein [Chitinophagaceae bacterium]
MRYLPLTLAFTATVCLVVLLNTQLPVGETKTPRLGYFLSPQYGFWQNAEPINQSFSNEISIQGIQANTQVYFDERLVPHIYAENNHDAYFVQGYLHAKFRLWQMEFQTYIAGGRLSEITGASSISTDVYLRRLGLLYGAENSLKMMESNPLTKMACDAYTAGVNNYISQLSPAQIPFEYKLMNYQPEKWSNLKTALFLKLMSFDLSGQGDEDFLQTNTKNFFGIETYKQLFPSFMDSLDPIAPKGTVFAKPSIQPKIPKNFDSVYLGQSSSFQVTIPIKPNISNGSNNWAVAGSKTQSGKPILCNDPHLGLNLPSLWYEIQISTPNSNTYGASFPGSPAVIIGFNDSCAWGVTNAGRDVKDFYEIQFKDSSMQEYWFNNTWQKTQFREEVIKIKDAPDKVEKIAMTVFGPVMYDRNYKAMNNTTQAYAVKWKAHDASNELLTFYQLNRATNFSDYKKAIATFECPGQNFVFASTRGDIAITQQGKFAAKWKRQGEFVMPGIDSSYLWQSYIANEEHVSMHNPERGFVSSANQMPADSTYPYYFGVAGNFPMYRGLIINKKLQSKNNFSVHDMQQMQTNNDNMLAAIALPILLKNISLNMLTSSEKKYFQLVSNWNNKNDQNEQGPTIFKLWFEKLLDTVYEDEYKKGKLPMQTPYESTLIEGLIRDSNYVFVDNIETPERETLSQINIAVFKSICKKIEELEKKDALLWGKYKNTKVAHFTGIDALSQLNVQSGGSIYSINATKSNHGPSWRMIVHLTNAVEAYGVYPGGQSGNPGSKYYNNFIDYWAKGNYYPLLFIKQQDATKHPKLKWHLQFIKA